MYSRCASSSVSTLHRAELERRELAHVEPEPRLPEEDRARRVAPDPPARSTTKSGAVERAGPTSAPTTSTARFSEPRRARERAAAAAPTSGRPSMRVRSPTRARRARRAAGRCRPARSRSCSARTSVERLARRVARERDDDPLDVEAPTIVGQLLGLAEQRQVLELRPALPRARVDEADEVDAVLGVLQELAGDELPDVARADDRSCSACSATLRRQSARAIARPRDHERDREQPRRGQLRERRRRELDEPTSRRTSSQTPIVTRWKMPTRSSVVEWSVPLLVAVVEPVELRQRRSSPGSGRRRLPSAGRRRWLPSVALTSACVTKKAKTSATMSAGSSIAHEPSAAARAGVRVRRRQLPAGATGGAAASVGSRRLVDRATSPSIT